MLADLYCVGAQGGVFEQAVVRVEQLAGNKEEELSLRSSIVQSGKGEELKCVLTHHTGKRASMCVDPLPITMILYYCLEQCRHTQVNTIADPLPVFSPK